MRTKRALALLLAPLCLLAGASEAAARSGSLPTGVTNIGSRDHAAFHQTRATGAQYIRIPLYWGGTAPRNKPASWQPDNPNDPHYDWGEGDMDVVRAVEAGLIPVLQVDGTPHWAQRCQTPKVLVPAICDPDPAELRSFATAAARRYSGQVPGLPRVDYWQALNEPNLSIFFFPQFSVSGKALSPDLYRDLVNSFYAGIKSVDPANIVVSAGLGPIAVPQWTIGPMSFARQMLCMRSNNAPAAGDCGGGVNFDVFAIQPYTTGGPTHEGKANDVQIGDLGKVQKLLRAAERAKRINSMFKRVPLWVTEFSWDTKPPDPGGLQMKIATRWTAEALHNAWRAGIAKFFWFSLRDEAPEPGRPNSESLESGLYFRGASVAQDQPKPVMQAFRFPLVAYPGKRLSFWGRTPSSGPGKVVLQALRGKRWVKLTTVRAASGGVFHGSLGSAYGRDKKGAVRALFRKQHSAPFAMRGVKSFRHPPFGKRVG